MSIENANGNANQEGSIQVTRLVGKSTYELYRQNILDGST